MNNVLIVENKNDKIFIERLIKHLKYPARETGKIDKESIIDSYRELNGNDSTKLKQALTDIKKDIVEGEVKKFGIILDLDLQSEQEKLDLIRQCLNDVFQQNIEGLEIGNFREISFVDVKTGEHETVQVACYFMNVEGRGELETVLKEIKTQDSPYADCISQKFKECLEEARKPIKDKELDKLWVNYYIRYDTCKRNERKQADKYCSMHNFDYVMNKDIWDLDHPILDDLKNFLKLF